LKAFGRRILLLFEPWNAARAVTPAPIPTCSRADRYRRPASRSDPLADWVEVILARQLVVHATVGSSRSMSPPANRCRRCGHAAGFVSGRILQTGPTDDVPGSLLAMSSSTMPEASPASSRWMPRNRPDATLGEPATVGCARVVCSAEIYEFGRLGMWVWAMDTIACAPAYRWPAVRRGVEKTVVRML
jgi:hypothetical protein